ncbi:MAG TPA: hypothetical protein PKL06_03090 [Chitinophagales bacterium]|nr:hypothetical protein [Chitinophagales bacterium]
MPASSISIKDLIYQLPVEDKSALDAIIIKMEVEKNRVFSGPEMGSKKLYYVVDGLIRKFAILHNKEQTLEFYFSNEVNFPMLLQSQIPLETHLQTVIPSVLFAIRIDQFEQLKSERPAIAKLETVILESAYNQVANRMLMFQSMNATERYHFMLQNAPEMVKLIPLKYISSWLGINNASLSKIRAQLK